MVGLSVAQRNFIERSAFFWEYVLLESEKSLVRSVCKLQFLDGVVMDLLVSYVLMLRPRVSPGGCPGSGCWFFTNF